MRTLIHFSGVSIHKCRHQSPPCLPPPRRQCTYAQSPPLRDPLQHVRNGFVFENFFARSDLAAGTRCGDACLCGGGHSAECFDAGAC
eukprot:335039-Chlamydomonas_euryale.AAC.4